MSTIVQHDSIYKVGYVEPEPKEFRFSNVFARENRKGTQLLCVATSNSTTELLKKLLKRMVEPLWLLYVLSVPRGEGEAGRYQSEDLFSATEVDALLDRYRNYLEADARHNFWIKSLDGPDLLVLDEHNLIYSYGPIDAWEQDLKEAGWLEVQRDDILLPNPHQHHYHAIFDDDARTILEIAPWIKGSLQEQDR